MRDGGRIVNLTSSVIGMRLPTYGAYIATKAAVEGMTQVLAQEMRGRGISVNAVAPGPVATELFLQGKSAELVDRMAKMNPLERLGQPADIASVVAFLAGRRRVGQRPAARQRRHVLTGRPPRPPLTGDRS